MAIKILVGVKGSVASAGDGYRPGTVIAPILTSTAGAAKIFAPDGTLLFIGFDTDGRDERIGRWIRMRRSLAPFSEPASLVHM